MTFQLVEVDTGDTIISFYGEEIGFATSHDTRHTHAADTYITAVKSFNGRKPSCSACRWFEVTLYRTDNKGYAAHTIGRSIVPGEQDYVMAHIAKGPYDLVEMLTVRRQSSMFLPAPSAKVLAIAANTDPDIRDAYVNRAVV